MSNPVQKGFSGWLIKRGGFNKGWKKRWFSYKQPRMTRTSEGMFAVRKACLQYFVSPENTKPKGKIIMEDIIDVTPATNFHNVEDLLSNLFARFSAASRAAALACACAIGSLLA